MISPRSTETEKKYQQFKKEKLESGSDLSAFNLDDEELIKEFDHWLIIKNRFPYDNMTSVNHMLVPKRQIDDFAKTNELERDEHEDIRRMLIEDEYYDAIVENLPRSKSVSRHAHLHLVRWKYTNEDGKNKLESQ